VFIGAFMMLKVYRLFSIFVIEISLWLI